MTILVRTPILRPFRGNQLVAALDATHPKGRTTIRYHRRHGNLPSRVPDGQTVPRQRASARAFLNSCSPALRYAVQANQEFLYSTLKSEGYAWQASSHGISKPFVIFTGFAAANDLDGKSPCRDGRAAPHELRYATNGDGEIRHLSNLPSSS